MKRIIPTIPEVKQRLKEPLYKNSFFLILNNILNGALGFVFWVIAARLYSPSHVGIASALIAVVMLLAAFSKLGFDMGLVRFLSAAEDKKSMINSCLTITCLASLIISLVVAAGLDFWSPALSFIREDIPFLILFIVLTTAFALSMMLNATFIAFRRAEFSVYQNTVIGVLRVSLPILAVSAGALGLFLSWGIGICLAIAMSLFLFLSRLQPKYRPLPRIERRVIKDMMRFSFMNYMAGILQNISRFLLPLLVINILGSEETAYFRIAWALSSVLFLTIPYSVTTALFAEGSHNQENLHKNAIRATGLILGLVIPGIAILFLLGDKILLLFGAAYSEYGLQVLRILVLSSIPATFIQLYLAIRVVQMKMRSVILISALTAVLVLGMTYALITSLGLVAVGISWTLSQVVVAGLVGAILLIGRRKRNKLKVVNGA